MFNFKKKIETEELEGILEHHRGCVLIRFNSEKYQEVIDNCNIILELKPNDSIGLEFKLRALLMLGDYYNSISVLKTLRDVEPHNSFIAKYDDIKNSMGA